MTFALRRRRADRRSRRIASRLVVDVPGLGQPLCVGFLEILGGRRCAASAVSTAKLASPSASSVEKPACGIRGVIGRRALREEAHAVGRVVVVVDQLLEQSACDRPVRRTRACRAPSADRSRALANGSGSGTRIAMPTSIAASKSQIHAKSSPTTRSPRVLRELGFELLGVRSEDQRAGNRGRKWELAPDAVGDSDQDEPIGQDLGSRRAAPAFGFQRFEVETQIRRARRRRRCCAIACRVSSVRSPPADSRLVTAIADGLDERMRRSASSARIAARFADEVVCGSFRMPSDLRADEERRRSWFSGSRQRAPPDLRSDPRRPACRHTHWRSDRHAPCSSALALVRIRHGRGDRARGPIVDAGVGLVPRELFFVRVDGDVVGIDAHPQLAPAVRARHEPRLDAQREQHARERIVESATRAAAASASRTNSPTSVRQSSVSDARPARCSRDRLRSVAARSRSSAAACSAKAAALAPQRRELQLLARARDSAARTARRPPRGAPHGVFDLVDHGADRLMAACRGMEGDHDRHLVEDVGHVRAHCVPT